MAYFTNPILQSQYEEDPKTRIARQMLANVGQQYQPGTDPWTYGLNQLSSAVGGSLLQKNAQEQYGEKQKDVTGALAQAMAEKDLNKRMQMYASNPYLQQNALDLEKMREEAQIKSEEDARAFAREAGLRLEEQKRGILGPRALELQQQAMTTLPAAGKLAGEAETEAGKGERTINPLTWFGTKANKEDVIAHIQAAGKMIDPNAVYDDKALKNKSVEELQAIAKDLGTQAQQRQTSTTQLQDIYGKGAGYKELQVNPAQAQLKPASVSAATVPTVNSPEEAMKLPKGTKFKTPDGRLMVV